VIKGEAARSAATAGAGESARLGVELSPGATKGKAAQAAAVAEAVDTVKAAVAAKTGKPWTTKDAMAARTAALNQADKELERPSWIGVGTKKPDPAIRQARAKQILFDQGLDPNTGQRIVPGTRITKPDGTTIVYKPASEKPGR
jgi:pyruvate/2-oxoglutarate dehydrogenase complex dihydrolipoamide acyltransferase (E2) component